MFRQLLESKRVDIGWGQPGGITGSGRLNRSWLEQSPEPRHVDLKSLAGGTWRVLTPNRIDQPVSRQNSIGIEQQNAQNKTLPESPEGQRPLTVTDLDRAEDPKLHIHPAYRGQPSVNRRRANDRGRQRILHRRVRRRGSECECLASGQLHLT